nr:hypothetical protein [Deltaproteobacteria bacterium]
MASLGVVVLVGTSGCYTKARDEARAAVVRLEQEKTGVNADLQRQREAVATAQRQVTELTERVRIVEAQNQQLRQTPRFYFDRAVDAETQATVANTDAADRTAIAAFHEVTTLVPGGPPGGHGHGPGATWRDALQIGPMPSETLRRRSYASSLRAVEKRPQRPRRSGVPYVSTGTNNST